MRRVSATEAVAEMRPAISHMGRDLAAALRGSCPPNDDFAPSIADAVALLTENTDPWPAG